MSNSVVYVGPYSFPNGGAAARRILGNCLSLKHAGYDVEVLTGQQSQVDVAYYQGIKVISYNERKYEHLPRYLKHLMYFSAGRLAVEKLEEMEVKPKAVIIYSGYTPYLIRVGKWCRKNGVKLIFDTVEWYDAPNKIKQYITPYYLNIEVAMRLLLKRCDGLIVISKYLEKYYSVAGCRMVRIPPTVFQLGNNTTKDFSKSSCIRFVYAGSPERKDLLHVIVKAIKAVADDGFDVMLDVAGVTDEQFERHLEALALAKINYTQCVKFHGYVEHESALKLVGNAHYSVIIRPDHRNVHAGFPTKFVESLFVGTPVVANIFSDIGDYLFDGVNGFISEGVSVEDVAQALRNAINCEDYLSLVDNASRTFGKHFNAINYASELNGFIENL